MSAEVTRNASEAAIAAVFVPVTDALVNLVIANFPGSDPFVALEKLLPMPIKLWKSANGRRMFLYRETRPQEKELKRAEERLHALLPPGTRITILDLCNMFHEIWGEVEPGTDLAGFRASMMWNHRECCRSEDSGLTFVIRDQEKKHEELMHTGFATKEAFLARLAEQAEPATFRPMIDVLAELLVRYGPWDHTIAPISGSIKATEISSIEIAGVAQFIENHPESGLRALSFGNELFLCRPPKDSEFSWIGFRDRCHALFPRGTMVSTESWMEAYYSLWPAQGGDRPEHERIRSFERSLLSVHRVCCGVSGSVWTVDVERVVHPVPTTKSSRQVARSVQKQAAQPVPDAPVKEGTTSEKSSSLSRGSTPAARSRSRSPPRAQSSHAASLSPASPSASEQSIILSRLESQMKHGIFRPFSDVYREYLVLHGSSSKAPYLATEKAFADYIHSKILRTASSRVALLRAGGRTFLSRALSTPEKQYLPEHDRKHNLFAPGSLVNMEKIYQAFQQAYSPKPVEFGVFAREFEKLHGRCCPPGPDGRRLFRKSEVRIDG